MSLSPVVNSITSEILDFYCLNCTFGEKWEIESAITEIFLSMIGEPQKIVKVTEISSDTARVEWSPKERISICFYNVLGTGLSKSVYSAVGYLGKNVAAFADNKEIFAMKRLQNKRGIAQLHNYGCGKFSGAWKTFFYGERYQTTLHNQIRQCNLEDMRVIVIDLVYAIIALEENDAFGYWLQHGDIKAANVFLKLDQTTKSVQGAYLGDFGIVSLRKTFLIDQTTLATWKQTDNLHVPHREEQRYDFMRFIFHRIFIHLDKRLGSTLTLTQLCESDPTAQKVMAEMEKEHGDIFKHPYVNWID